MRYFSVAYRPLEWPMPRFMEVVSAAPLGEGITDLSADYPQFAGRDPVLGEYAALFALRRHLEEARARGEGSVDGMVGISHYRRFAVTRPTGTPSFVYGVVRPAEFIRLSRERFVPRTGTILFPGPIQVPPSLLAHFSQFHHARDLMLFMALAIDLDVVTNDQVTNWLAGNVMVPAPAIGIYPEDWFIETQTALESVVDAFEMTVGVPREGYNRRSIAFCLERLHGLLLSRSVAGWPQDRLICQPALIVSRDGVYHPGGAEEAEKVSAETPVPAGTAGGS